MRSSRTSFPVLSLLLCSVLVLSLSACGGDAPTSSESARRSDLVPPVQQHDVVFPIPPAVNYCASSNVGTILDVETDAAAGVAYSSNVFIPASGGVLNVYFANLGPGPITFVSTPGAWSVGGTDLALGTSNEIPLTPTGSSATLNDGYWGGTFQEGFAFLGCLFMNDISFKSAKHKHATAHLDLSFLRDGVLHTVRVNVRTSNIVL